MRRWLLLCVLAVLALPASALGATVTVDCDGLTAALADGSNDTIILEAGELCGGSYVLPDRTLTLRGQDGAGFQPTTPDARSLTTDGRVSGNQTIDNIDFHGPSDPTAGGSSDAAQRQNATMGGGMSYQGDSLTITNSSFTNIASMESGGGLLVDNRDEDDQPAGSVTITGTDFTDNSTLVNGGGARIISADVEVSGSTFTTNTAGDSGGGLALTMPNTTARTRAVAPADADAKITGTTFDQNTAVTDGDTGPIDVGGGGLYVDDSATNDFDGIVTDTGELQNRRAAAEGAGHLALGDNTYTGNALLPDLANFQAPDFADRNGGGAQFVGIAVKAFTTETYRGNIVLGFIGASAGGGFALTASPAGDAEYTGENTVIIGNGVGNLFTSGWLRDRITSEQPEGPAGGGVYVGDAGTVSLVHATIVENQLLIQGLQAAGPALQARVVADMQGGFGIEGASEDATANVDRSIVFDNTQGDGSGDIPGGQITGATATVTNSDDQDLCEVTGDRRADDGNLCAAPVFVVDDKGGAPKQDATSPTVDALATTPVTDDFEHEKRPMPSGGKADMGADELFQADPVVTTTPTVTVSPTPTVTASPKPTVTPRPVASPTPGPGNGVEDNSDNGAKRKCKSRRFFRITLRRRVGVTYVSARFVVDGKKVKTHRFGDRLGAKIDLRGLTKRTVRVRIVATTSTGRVVKGERTYHPCYRGRKPHKLPQLRSAQ